MESKDQYNYTLTKVTTLAGAAEVLTIQLPAAPTKNVHMQKVTLQATVSCDVTIERDGTAATTTAQTPTPVLASTPASGAAGFNTSNVGAGTVRQKIRLPANGLPIDVDLSDMWIMAAALTGNISFRSSSITGDVLMTVFFGENLA